MKVSSSLIYCTCKLEEAAGSEGCPPAPLICKLGEAAGSEGRPPSSFYISMRPLLSLSLYGSESRIGEKLQLCDCTLS
jgi:hypothetical protein